MFPSLQSRLTGARTLIGIGLYVSLSSIVVVGTTLLNYYILIILSFPAPVAGTLFGIGSALAIPASFLAGYLGKRYGTSRVLAVATLITSLSYMGLALFRTSLAFGLFYSLAVSSGFVPQVSLPALISELTKEKNTGKALGAMNTIGSGIGVLGAILAGLIAQSVGFSSLFLTVAIISLISALVLISFVIPKLRESSESATKQGNSAKAMLSFTRRNKSLLLASFAVMFLAIGLFADKFYPAYIADRIPVSSTEIAAFDSVYFGVWLAASLPAGFLSDRYGPKSVTILGYAVMGASLLAFPFTSSLLTFYFLYGIFSLGNAFGYYIILTGIRTVGKENASMASGIVNGFTTIGVALSGPFGGVLWATIGQSNCFLLALPASIIAIMSLVPVTQLGGKELTI